MTILHVHSISKYLVVLPFTNCSIHDTSNTHDKMNTFRACAISTIRNITSSSADHLPLSSRSVLAELWCSCVSVDMFPCLFTSQRVLLGGQRS